MPTLRPHTITATTATISTTLLITSTICSMMIRVMLSVTSSPLSGARTAHHCLNFVLLTKMRRYLLYLKLSRGPPIDTMVFQTDGWILYELVRLSCYLLRYFELELFVVLRVSDDSGF